MANDKRMSRDFSPFQSLLLITIILLGGSIATDTITQFQGISVGQTLVSSGQIFELGFFSPDSSTNQYIGIWYKNISGQKPVWVANRENPLSVSDSDSSLTIGSDGNLRLLNGIKNTIWSTNISSQVNGTIAVLSDQGDLSLKDEISGLILWDSFDYPGDTFISGMKIGTNPKTGEKQFLTSWKSENDTTIGNFTMGITHERPPQALIWKSDKPFWRSGPWDSSKFIGLYETRVGYSNGFIVTQDDYLTYGANSGSYMTLRLTLDGNLKMSYWTRDSPGGGVPWEAIRLPCDIYNTCGPFGFCDRRKSKSCKCLDGFMPKSREEWRKGNWTGGCVRRSELQCGVSQSNEKSDGFRKLRMMKVPDHHEYFSNKNASSCKNWCLSNCSCTAYASVAGIECMVWTSEVLDVQQFSSGGVDLFLRLASSELGKSKKKMVLIVLLTTITGLIIVVAIVYSLYRRMTKPKVKRSPQKEEFNWTATQTESSDLPIFDFSILATATGNFNEKNKLGGGGFGPVYKGKLEDGLEIAVKRLSSHSGQGIVEFKNEILLISKLQHRNLVRLLGYSIKGDEKLLIYEFLRNKSLDTFLFDAKSGVELHWDKRLNIIQGIARGLLYLHRDSRLRIIHRDLKAGNILLDDNLNPKISDFGLARVFQVTQELANTHRVVGTFGYMSPEYAISGLFSEKSDIFSFGILVLEILSGRRNTSFYHEEKCNLIGYAWQLWRADRGLELMDPLLSDSCRHEEFLQCMHIAILCTQDHTYDRPTMSNVVSMLTNEINLPNPKAPTFFQSLLTSDIRSDSIFSVNDASMSQVDGR